MLSLLVTVCQDSMNQDWPSALGVQAYAGLVQQELLVLNALVTKTELL